jgi:hypothetical protein
VVHHEHAEERHLGKSEACGLAGNSLVAFGPALAQQGIAVLAPDSICFEVQRRSGTPTVATAVYARVGDRHCEAALRNKLADLYHVCGQSDAAMQQIKQAVAIFAEAGAEAETGYAEIWMLSGW